MSEKLIMTKQLADVLNPYRKDIKEEIAKEFASDVIEPAADDLPTVFISGEMPESKTYVKAELEYISKTERFKSPIYIKLQGTSTLMWDKKNYAIAMYSDEARIRKLNKNFKGWGYHNNYVLKADYIDGLKARNVVCAKLWGDVVRSRPDFNDLPEELKNSPNCGAIDGFPVRVYVNGEFYGLYNWTIPKCDWLFGLDEKNLDHALISAQINDNGNGSILKNPCNFLIYWDKDGQYADAWEIEIGSAEESVIRNFFNEIINHTADLNFPFDLLDEQSYIDYYIFQDVILGTDGLAKNMLLVTYDMQKWYFSAYDMDATFDLSWEGYSVNGAGLAMPDGYNNQYSVLFGKYPMRSFDSVRERYIELRKSVLSYASILSAFERYIGIYGYDNLWEDYDIWGPPNGPDGIYYLREFVKNRLAFLDEKYEVSN